MADDHHRRPPAPPPVAHLVTASRVTAPYHTSCTLDEKAADRQPRHDRQFSPSSAARSARTLDTIDVEKQALEDVSDEPEEEYASSGLPYAPSAHHPSSQPPASPHVHRIKQRYDVDDDDPFERKADRQMSDNSIRLLLFFLLALPLLSFLLSLASLLLALLLALLHPIRLIFTRKRSFAAVCLSVLAPLLNIHLEAIYTPPVGAEELALGKTLVALVGGCVVTAGMSAWAAILGVYWCFAAIIGNPDGLDARSEGREMVLTTRGKWEGWLRMGVKGD